MRYAVDRLLLGEGFLQVLEPSSVTVVPPMLHAYSFITEAV